MLEQKRSKNFSGEDTTGQVRFRIVAALVSLIGFIIIGRLVVIMIFNHDFYTKLAAGSQELYSQLFPKRGQIFIKDSRTNEEYPLAINKDYFTLYADTREIIDEAMAEDTTKKLSELLSYNDEKKLELYLQLNKRTDPYEPLEPKVDQATVDAIERAALPGIHFVRKPFRFYPEGTLAAQVVGFLGKQSDGTDVGRYGVEGYWDKELAGTKGFLEGARSAKGGWIPLAGRIFKPAEHGSDILLTIDRTIQFHACEILRRAQQEYGALSASLVIMDPKTGAIRAMCSMPDFDPNRYNQVASVDVYNNTTIFTPYEPGSIFKPITVAAAINEEVVSPTTYFNDTGENAQVCSKPIKNAEKRIYHDTTVSGILENSINTGVIFVAQKVGKKKFIEYIERFGFGIKEGIDLDTEVGGTIDTLSIHKNDDFDCYAATASFGQGISVTPLQMTVAFGAIVNGGMLMRPYIVEEVRHEDGKVERTAPKEVRRVLSRKAASLVSSMLVNVVDKGQTKAARVPGYYVGGKTGTAQIAEKGGYSLETNHSFIGFGPIDDPRFVMFVKFEKPQRTYADSTAAPVFRTIAQFIFQYYDVPPSRDRS